MNISGNTSDYETRTHQQINDRDSFGYYLSEYLKNKRLNYSYINFEKHEKELNKKRNILGLSPSPYFSNNLGLSAFSNFKYGVQLGNLSATYTEYSGLTAPRLLENANYLWAIEDGPTKYLLAIDKANASLAGKWTLTGVTSSDIEDVTSFSMGGVGYIVLADTGDNANARSTFKLFRVKEPVITGSDGTVSAGDVETIVCQYPVADVPNHKDCECILADPETGDLYLITKRLQVSGPGIKCYKLPYAASYTGTQTLEYMGGLTSDPDLNTISTTISSNNGYVTGGDISPDGDEIILRSYSALYLWRRVKGESIYGALSRIYDSKLTDVYVGGGLTSFHPTQEPQGESLSFDYYGEKFYTCSELVTTQGSSGARTPLFMYERVFETPVKASFQNGSDGYSGCQDTYIDQTATGAANTTNFSTATSMVMDIDFSVYPTISRYRQSLIKWDISAIPTNATVIGAYLDLYISNEGKQFALYKMLQDWNAATITYANSGGIALDNVEAVSTPDALFGTTLASGALDTYTGFVKVNLPISTVQSWVTSPSTNFGYMGTGGPNETTGDGLQIESCESLTQSRKPKLNIIYVI